MKIVRLPLVTFTLRRCAALAEQSTPQTSPASGGIEMHPTHDGGGPAVSAWPRWMKDTVAGVEAAWRTENYRDVQAAFADGCQATGAMESAPYPFSLRPQGMMAARQHLCAARGQHSCRTH